MARGDSALGHDVTNYSICIVLQWVCFPGTHGYNTHTHASFKFDQVRISESHKAAGRAIFTYISALDVIKW